MNKGALSGKKPTASSRIGAGGTVDVRNRCRDIDQRIALRELFVRGNKQKSSTLGEEGNTDTAIASSDFLFHDSSMHMQSCALPGVMLSREECEYRGCCCVSLNSDGSFSSAAGAGPLGSSGLSGASSGGPSSSSSSGAGPSSCDFCALERSSEVVQTELRAQSAARSGRYIARGLSEFPHFVVLGANGMIFRQEALEHWGKLAERMLIQAFLEEDLPKLLSSQLEHAYRHYGIDFILSLNYASDYPRKFAQAGISAVVAGEAPRNLRSSIKKLVRGNVKAQCQGGVCYLLKTKIQQLLLRQDQIFSQLAAGGPQHSSSGSSSSSGGSAGSSSSGAPTGGSSASRSARAAAAQAGGALTPSGRSSLHSWTGLSAARGGGSSSSTSSGGAASTATSAAKSAFSVLMSPFKSSSSAYGGAGGGGGASGGSSTITMSSLPFSAAFSPQAAYLSGNNNAEKIVLSIYLSPTEKNPAQVAALSLATEAKKSSASATVAPASRNADEEPLVLTNKHVVDVQRHVSDTIGFHLRQLFHWSFADLLELLVRRRRPEIHSGASSSNGGLGAGSSATSSGEDMAAPSQEGTDGSSTSMIGDVTSSSSSKVEASSSTSLPALLRQEGAQLRRQIEDIERAWTEACPHHRLYDVRVLMPTAQPAECLLNAEEVADQRDQIVMLSPFCHFDNKDSHWCSTSIGSSTAGGEQQGAGSQAGDRQMNQQAGGGESGQEASAAELSGKSAERKVNESSSIPSPSATSKNGSSSRRQITSVLRRSPFFGTVVVRFQGHPLWKVHRWLTRNDRERECDHYIADRWVFVQQIPVVPEWRHSASVAQTAHPVKAPEIASESKLGCLREGAMKQTPGVDQVGGGGPPPKIPEESDTMNNLSDKRRQERPTRSHQLDDL
ncbi:unnamed protein product [Amoebophrya sp. A25]|nr:unnamed protein product [Amoebophrya sp. A25]|eukprot:GSA25T00002378001.1